MLEDQRHLPSWHTHCLGRGVAVKKVEGVSRSKLTTRSGSLQLPFPALFLAVLRTEYRVKV
jgi:hypothetical protein